MTAVFAVLAAAGALAGPPALDPEQLPQLPARGLVRDHPVGIELETMRGRPLGLLQGFHLAHRLGAHGLLLQNRTAALFTIDVGERRIRQVSLPDIPGPSGCTFSDGGARVRLYVCGHRIVASASGGRRVVARAPGRVGHWEFADLSPDGSAILAQWSAECEVPVAFLIVGKTIRPFGARSFRESPSSVALGWLPKRTAVVHFPEGACGGSFRRPGIYAVSRTGRARLLRPTGRLASFEMWGG